MDQTLIPAGLEQLLQFAILLFVVFGFFRQFATQKDIERLGDRLGRIETRLDSVEPGSVMLIPGLVMSKLGWTESNKMYAQLARKQTRLWICIIPSK